MGDLIYLLIVAIIFAAAGKVIDFIKDMIKWWRDKHE